MNEPPLLFLPYPTHAGAHAHGSLPLFDPDDSVTAGWFGGGFGDV
jgi:hypothetical protein